MTDWDGKSTLRQLQTRVATLERELAEAREQSEARRKALVEVSAERRAEWSRAEAAEASIAGLHDMRETLQRELAEAREQIETVRELRKFDAQKIADRERELASVEQDLEAAEAKLAAEHRRGWERVKEENARAIAAEAKLAAVAGDVEPTLREMRAWCSLRAKRWADQISAALASPASAEPRCETYHTKEHWTAPAEPKECGACGHVESAPCGAYDCPLQMED